MKNKLEITDRLANSIRGLWHIESMEEKKRLIRYYNNLCCLFFLVKNHPESFSQEELEKYKQKTSALTQAEKDLISEIFLTLHMGIISDPLEYTVEEMRAFYSKGLYFTKEELEEMIDWQFYSKKHNAELIALIEEYLDKHLYFDTLEDAEKAWNEYEASHPNKNHNKPQSYLPKVLSKALLPRFSQ